MADPPKRREWTTSSGTYKMQCPRCQDEGASVDCEICSGTNEVGLAAGVQWILKHGPTDPAPPRSGDE